MYIIPLKYRPREQWAFSWIFFPEWHFFAVFHWNEKSQNKKKPWNITYEIK